jgi:hypothetical protein
MGLPGVAGPAGISQVSIFPIKGASTDTWTVAGGPNSVSTSRFEGNADANSNYLYWIDLHGTTNSDLNQYAIGIDSVASGTTLSFTSNTIYNTSFCTDKNFSSQLCFNAIITGAFRTNSITNLAADFYDLTGITGHQGDNLNLTGYLYLEKVGTINQN